MRFTHLDKVMFPAQKLTKRDVIEYYGQVADHLLPYLRDRPITVERLPDGLSTPGAPRFWQKNTPAYYPEWIPRIPLPSERGKPVQYPLVNDVQTLLYMVNQGTITFHTYFSRVQSLERPDFVLFDLDPGQAPFRQVVEIARKLHAILDADDVKSFVKTSGKTGLHVLVPWTQSGGYDEARAWATTIATRLVETMPDLATTQRSKSSRHGKIYVDVQQNALGHHAVPPYVLRAVPDATVSTPLQWKEVTAKLDPDRFTTKAVVARLKRSGDPMAPLLPR